MVSQPIESITNNDHAGYIILTIYASFFLTLIFWVSRIGFRFRRQGFMLDDGFLIAAMVLSLVQSICLQLAINSGFGKRSITGEVHLADAERYFYAANLLDMLCQTCAKISVVLMFHQLKPFPAFLYANYASLGLATAWGIASIFALAFQCDLPHPWALGLNRCVNLHSLYLGIDIVNLLSEVFLMILPAIFMPKVQTGHTVHVVVVLCFAARLGVIAPIIGHIVTLPGQHSYADPTWSCILPTIWLQVVMNASVLTACIPGMQRVLAELRSGIYTVNVDTDAVESGRYGSVFGTNSSRVRTDISHNGEKKIWEMARMGSTRMKSTSEDHIVGTDTDRRHDLRTITITKEVEQVAEFE